MIYADRETVAEFIVEAAERLEWMDRELTRVQSDSDRRALAAAREELVRMLGRIVCEGTHDEAR
jgi:hypothetical protein